MNREIRTRPSSCSLEGTNKEIAVATVRTGERRGNSVAVESSSTLNFGYATNCGVPDEIERERERDDAERDCLRSWKRAGRIFGRKKDFPCPAGHVRGVEGNFVYVFTVAGFAYVLADAVPETLPARTVSTSINRPVPVEFAETTNPNSLSRIILFRSRCRGPL